MRDLLQLSALMVLVEDYQKAKDNFFAPAQKIWFMFGGTIKRLESDLGNEIESHINSINSMLDQASPDSSLKNSLDKLNQLMESAVKISDEKI
ncbi:hypothetical protein [Acaryochloris sp. IP29b_bin.137]|uniref:hypothetical protein n=1 Tax=Acaryochloris sp. IP29b_bin.137 TaxID=2969217 RepID=UPI00260DF7DB|nr:hypothetical protein [Acaryochloris sp. IP29b_bin.137]